MLITREFRENKLRQGWSVNWKWFGIRMRISGYLENWSR